MAGKEITRQLCEQVAEVYAWLDSEIAHGGELAGECRACGKCCDFGSFDHRLFVTTAELMYLEDKLGSEGIRPMTTVTCPYNSGGRCGIYEYRFAGCRVFCCRGDTDFQSRLSESALKRLKSVCTEFGVPYRYCELASGLNSFAEA